MRILTRPQFVNTCPKGTWFIKFEQVSLEEANGMMPSKVLAHDGKRYKMVGPRIKGETLQAAATLILGTFEYATLSVYADPSDPDQAELRFNYVPDDFERRECLFGVLTHGELLMLNDEVTASLDTYRLLSQLAGN